MDLSLLQGIVLGIVQGLTEFLPVSSSGHLVLLQHVMDFDPESADMIIFDLAVHLGTVFAILVYFRRDSLTYLGHLGRDVGMLQSPVQAWRKSASMRFSMMALASIFTTGVFYVLCKSVIKQGFGNPMFLVVCWVVTATLLIVTDRNRRSIKKIRQIGIYSALIIGLFQGLAMMPGISRSGSTICAAVLLGMHRKWAGEYSFLIGVPTILGATLLECLDYFKDNPLILDSALIGGMISSTVFGFGALWLLMWMLRQAKLLYFSIYCYLLAGGTLIAILAGWL